MKRRSSQKKQRDVSGFFRIFQYFNGGDNGYFLFIPLTFSLFLVERGRGEGLYFYPANPTSYYFTFLIAFTFVASIFGPTSIVMVLPLSALPRSGLTVTSNFPVTAGIEPVKLS